MNNLSEYKDYIYNKSLEKQAGIGSAIEGAAGKIVGSGIGGKVINSGIGTKMAVGAGLGAAKGLLQKPQDGESRLGNTVSGAAGGAALGATVHTIGNGIKDVAAMRNMGVATNGASNVMSGVNRKVVYPAGSVGADGIIYAGGSAPKLALPEPQMPSMAGHYESLMEKRAGLMGTATKVYNSFAGKPIKNALIGTGIGAAIGGTKYNPEKEDGSFEHSRFGAMAGGAITGAGIGTAVGLGFKKYTPKVTSGAIEGAVENSAKGALNDAVKETTASEILDLLVMEKEAGFLQTAGRGMVDAWSDLKKVDETTRMAIGASIGATVGAVNALKNQRGKEDMSKKDKWKNLGKATLEGASIGSFVGSAINYKR